jgi:hypothetical protein
MMVAAAIDLAGSWTTFWNSVSGSLGRFSSFMAIAGMLIVVGGIFMHLWERKRGGSPGYHKLIISLVIGGILSGPTIFIPVLLTLADFIVNAMASAFGSGK